MRVVFFLEKIWQNETFVLHMCFPQKLYWGCTQKLSSALGTCFPQFSFDEDSLQEWISQLKPALPGSVAVCQEGGGKKQQQQQKAESIRSPYKPWLGTVLCPTPCWSLHYHVQGSSAQAACKFRMFTAFALSIQSSTIIMEKCGFLWFFVGLLTGPLDFLLAC